MEMNSVPLSHLVVTLQMVLPNYHPLLCLDQILMEMVPSLPSFALDNLQLVLTLGEVFLWIRISLELRMFLSSRTTPPLPCRPPLLPDPPPPCSRKLIKLVVPDTIDGRALNERDAGTRWNVCVPPPFLSLPLPSSPAHPHLRLWLLMPPRELVVKLSALELKISPKDGQFPSLLSSASISSLHSLPPPLPFLQPNPLLRLAMADHQDPTSPLSDLCGESSGARGLVARGRGHDESPEASRSTSHSQCSCSWHRNLSGTARHWLRRSEIEHVV
jgi:hypothetical protein